MTTTTHRTAGFAAAVIAALTALVIAAPLAGASQTSPPPKLSGKHMHWYRWHPSPRVLQGRTAEFGSTAVLGLESMDDLPSLRAAYGFERVRAIPGLHAAEVRVDRAQLHALLANAPTDSRVRYVSPVGPPRRPMSMPNDPLVRTIDGWTNLPYEWQFAAARVDRALDLSKGDPAIVVGMIDTGAADVPDLTGKVNGRWSFGQDGMLTSDSLPEGNDDYGHGTAVASLIAANVDDGFGMAGFGGATHVIAVRAGDQGFFFDTQVAIALTKLVSLGVRIINMSIGGRLPSEPILVDAIHKAAADGVLLVASAGNENDTVSWPAADLQPSDGGRSFGLAVGATDFDGRLAEFSNSGKHLSLVAPGNYGGTCSGVLVALPPFSRFDESSCSSTWAGTGGAHYGYLAGTSFSAPEVAGVAALIWAARPELKNYQVADIIKQSARRTAATEWTPTMGCGLLDAGAALQLATDGGWATGLKSDVACSVAGNEPPAWPTEANQTITFGVLANKTFGDRDFAVGATALSGLPVSFTASGDCTVSGAKVHITGAGSCSVTASQPGDANYNLAPSVSRSFLIAEAAARSVRAIPASGTWGSTVNLPFRVSEGRGDVAVKMVVQKNWAAVVHLARGFFRVEPGQLYALAWHAPRTQTKGVFRFCVTLRDRAGNKSAPSCGRIGLR